MSDELETRLSPPTTERGRLQRAALAVLLEHERHGELPTSGRFVFYELEQAGVVSKELPINPRTGQRRKRTSAQDVADALMHLREQAIVPWGWLVDETRRLSRFGFGFTIAEHVRALVAIARLDAWAGDPPPLLLCESRSLAGVLDPVAERYLCPIAATNGQVGGFLHTDIAPLLDDRRAVLYLGDHDLQGGQIEANTRRVLVRAAGHELAWRRVAITAEQIAERGLTPIVKTDRRYRPAVEHEAWETEALGQRAVVALVRDALDALLPEPLEDVQVREHEQRAAVAALLDHDA